jgi:hypothetical protein
MNRKRKQDRGVGGLDSFQDIVANLVGVLIILVIIVMVRTREAIVSAQTYTVQEEALNVNEMASREAIDDAQRESKAIEKDIHDLEEVSARQQIELTYRQAERDKLQQLVSAVENRLTQDSKGLSNLEQISNEEQFQFEAKRKELGDLIRSRQVLDNMKKQINVIDHIPTPMAETVFGDEIHFRLENGRISYVPFSELVDRMKSHAAEHLANVRVQKTVTNTLGPVEGFELRYQLGYVSQIVRTDAGPRRQERIELIKLEVLPIDSTRGETVAVALKPGSRFLQYVQRLVPDTATVTIWVYPDSFTQFREIKDKLLPLGYACAGRPLPDGMPISASPKGTRSVSQ